jgi:hypothetical protein
LLYGGERRGRPRDPNSCFCLGAQEFLYATVSDVNREIAEVQVKTTDTNKKLLRYIAKTKRWELIPNTVPWSNNKQLDYGSN